MADVDLEIWRREAKRRGKEQGQQEVRNEACHGHGRKAHSQVHGSSPGGHLRGMVQKKPPEPSSPDGHSFIIKQQASGSKILYKVTPLPSISTSTSTSIFHFSLPPCTPSSKNIRFRRTRRFSPKGTYIVQEKLKTSNSPIPKTNVNDKHTTERERCKKRKG